MPKFLAVLGAASLLYSSAALAQASGHHGHGNAGATPQRPDPQGAAERDPAPKRNTAALPSSPAFQGYRPYRGDEPMVGWREANDLVREIGGHAGIMKGAAGKNEPTDAHAGHQKAKPEGAAK